MQDIKVIPIATILEIRNNKIKFHSLKSQNDPKFISYLSGWSHSNGQCTICPILIPTEL